MVSIFLLNVQQQLTVSSQVFNHAETSLTVSNRSIKIVLLAMLVHTEALKVDIPPGAELRLNRTGNVNRRLHGELLHPALHNRKLDRNHTRHLNGATERNLAIALREMQIPNRELGPLDMHRKVNLAAARQVFDVAVAAVLRATGDRAGALVADFLFDVVARGSGVHILGLRRLCDVAVHVRARFDQAAFALVPSCEDFGGGRAAEDAWVDEAGEFDAWDVAGGAVDSFEVPDCFCSGLVWVSPCELLLGEVLFSLTAWGRSRPGIHLSSNVSNMDGRRKTDHLSHLHSFSRRCQ